MRKRISSQPQEEPSAADQGWLDVEALAMVEVTSEDEERPIECAFLPDATIEWRAQSAGKQTVRLLFDNPHSLRRIRLVFREMNEARTQEFVLRWSPAPDSPSREILRQQYHFSPSGATEEIEEYGVELEDVAVLELTIVPNLSGGGFASLAQFQLA
jgi:hypothetical protein